MVKSLFSTCMGYILSHPDLYYNDFILLPQHIKTRILKRITTMKLHSNIKYIFNSLIHSRLKEIDFSLYEVDDEFLKLISNCTWLRKLILTRNKHNMLTESALIEVMPNFKNLYIFHASICSAITDEVMNVIVQNSPNLMELDISDCLNISDKTLNEIATFKSLTALNISRTNITDEGIKLFLKGEVKTTLKELRMAECSSITANAINLVCEQCQNLQVFIFNNCSNNKDLGEATINFENENFKKLKQLTWSVYW